MFNIKVLSDKAHDRYKEFYEIIEDLLELEDVQGLHNFSQHLNTSRLEHSIYVAYFSYLSAKKMKLDYKSAARGALLHDLFHYNWWEHKHESGNHAKNHPKIALENARNLVKLNDIEADSILKHMWPLTISPPAYKESIIVTLADKVSATMEVFSGMGYKSKMKKALKKAEVTEENLIETDELVQTDELIEKA